MGRPAEMNPVAYWTGLVDGNGIRPFGDATPSPDGSL